MACLWNIELFYIGSIFAWTEIAYTNATTVVPLTSVWSISVFRYATVTEPLHCVYKFDYDKYSGTFDLEDDNSPVGEVNRHKFYGEWFLRSYFRVSVRGIHMYIPAQSVSIV